MTLNTFGTQEEALAMLARYFIQLANEAIEDRNHFAVVLSGGRTPLGLYRLLSSPAYSDKVSDWSRVFFFFGDEQYVPYTEPGSHYATASDVLLAPLHLSSANVFPVNTSLPPEEAAAAYQQQIEDFYMVTDIRFDLILLGLDTNGQTAALLPHSSILQDSKPGIRAVEDQATGQWHITFNAPFINNARHIAFLAFGSEKAGIMQQVLQGTPDTDRYPAQLIRRERIAWFTDTAAAALLR